ncbi:DNA ligase, partial [Striga asiatica]
GDKGFGGQKGNVDNHSGSKNDKPLNGNDAGPLFGPDMPITADGRAGPYGPWMMAKTTGRPFRGAHKGTNWEADGEAPGTQPDIPQPSGVNGDSRGSLTGLGVSKGTANTGGKGEWRVVTVKRRSRTSKTNKQTPHGDEGESSGLKKSGGVGPHLVARSSDALALETRFLDALCMTGRAISSQQAMVVPMESDLDSSKHLAVQVLDSTVLDPVTDNEFDIDPSDSAMEVTSPCLATQHHDRASHDFHVTTLKTLRKID